MSDIPESVSKALRQMAAEAAENAVSSRTSATPAAPVVTAKAAKLSPAARIGRNVQKQYANTVGANDPKFTAHAKGMIQSSDTAGGSLLPDEFSSDYVEVLRDSSVLAKAGCRVYEYSKSLNIGKMGATTAEFVAEGAAPTASTVTTASVVLGHKKCAALASASLEMLRNPSVNSAEIIGQDLSAAVVAKADEQLLVGTGAGANPTGLIAQVVAGNKFSANAVPTVSTIIEELDRAEALVRASKINIDGSASWIMSSATYMALKSLRDSAGWVFRDELSQGFLNGYKVLVTEAVTADNVIFGVFSAAALGVSAPLETEMGHNGTDFASGNLSFVSSVGTDIKLRHTNAFAVILDTDVWSA